MELNVDWAAGLVTNKIPDSKSVAARGGVMAEGGEGNPSIAHVTTHGSKINNKADPGCACIALGVAKESVVGTRPEVT